MMTIIPQPYIGQGLLDDNERNNILSTFAGGLLSGYTVNPQPVGGMYFTPIGATNTMVQDGMQQQSTALTAAEFQQLMQDEINRQNMMTDFGADDGSGNVGVDLPGEVPDYKSISDFVQNGLPTITQTGLGLPGLLSLTMDQFFGDDFADMSDYEQALGETGDGLESDLGIA